MIRSWPTRDGWIVALLVFALVDVGAIGGNNLIVLVGCIGGAALGVDWLAGRWNLRGLAVRWRLPEELFAGIGGRGAFVVHNRRGVGTARALLVDDGHALAEVDAVPAAGEVEARAWWRFPERGRFAVEGVEVRSTYPFGFFTHRAPLEGRATGLVYPRPLSGTPRPAGEVHGDASEADRRDGTGDFRDLRPYRPGDRLHAIHWRTSARAGEPMVVVRGGERSAGVRVHVSGVALEDELSRAAGAILEAFARGVPVGLELPGDGLRAEPRSGVRWRRELLDTLAVYEERP